MDVGKRQCMKNQDTTLKRKKGKKNPKTSHILIEMDIHTKESKIWCKYAASKSDFTV